MSKNVDTTHSGVYPIRCRHGYLNYVKLGTIAVDIEIIEALSGGQI